MVALGSEDLNLYEELKNILFTNQAVTGEAAALGISLLMAGTGNQDVNLLSNFLIFRFSKNY